MTAELRNLPLEACAESPLSGRDWISPTNGTATISTLAQTLRPFAVLEAVRGLDLGKHEHLEVVAWI